MTELSLAQVDFKEVLYRLALHARHLITAARCLGVEELVLPGGDSPEDMASATLLKLLDPGNSSVAWSEGKGPPTTEGLMAFLRVVLERDFLDLVRSRRGTPSTPTTASRILDRRNSTPTGLRILRQAPPIQSMTR